MRQDLTDVTVVLDRSGSMAVVRKDTEGGFDTFVEEQKKAKGEALLTLVQFDNFYEFVYQGKNIQEVEPLKLTPRGGTALLDAMGRAINETGERLSKMPEASRPGKVIFVIMTDGQENASAEFSKSKINEMIKHQRETYNWQFVFLGANQDAIHEAGALGILAQNAMTYGHNPMGVKMSMQATAKNLRHYAETGDPLALAYSSAQREDAVMHGK